ncbi:MAG: type II secretion system minor pseudopilin GspK [Litorimonas sp.]
MARSRDDGTVLLSTLLVLSLMSAVALALLATVQTSVTRTAQLGAAAQADLYARGAADFVQSQMDAIGGTDDALLNARLAQPESFTLPFENGAIIATVSDGTHCFRLSALSTSNGTGSDTAQARFQSLMEAVGVDRNRAARIAAAAVDWVDTDSETRPGGAEDGPYLSRRDGPHRTANVPMQSVTELRAVEGMDEALFRLLLPHVCIGAPGVPTPFNINTATEDHALVLAALLGGGREAETAALALIRARPGDGYTAESLAAAPALQDFDNAGVNPAAVVVYGPERLVAEVVVRFDTAERMQLLAFEGLDSRTPDLTYRSWGADEFPSLARARLAQRGNPAEGRATGGTTQ